ncbi:hypothetical protein F2Q69_00028963 [Brassica cretica]|uniref:Uncharacterized protein n=1 Tax=Brassica cretica TaxID=69181 RepID=A0A8S9S9J8_BRACR|nr:hypothetical protein F2Q69_00028963 [Brassica cretica]
MGLMLCKNEGINKTGTMMSSRDVIDQNEIQTYASLEKMLHKAIHAVRQLKKKGNTYTSSAPKQTISFQPRFVHPTVPIRLTEQSRNNGKDRTEFERVDFKIDRATSSLASSECTGWCTGPVCRTCFKIH